MTKADKVHYIFDVDGTLTKPRQKMSKKNEQRFQTWAQGKSCYIATGSDFQKTKQQLSQQVLDCFSIVFCCMGNEVRKPSGDIVSRSNFVVPSDLSLVLERFLNNSNFPHRTGNHFEVRTGMLNFSIVGRNADLEQREQYLKWDSSTLERRDIADFINNNYPNLEASVGGSISIDIIERGKDKGQIIEYMKSEGVKKVVFVGDRCFPGGNDYGIVRELNTSKLAFEWYNVSGPRDTFKLIKENKVF